MPKFINPFKKEEDGGDNFIERLVQQAKPILQQQYSPQNIIRSLFPQVSKAQEIGQKIVPSIITHLQEKAPIGALLTGKPQEFIPRLQTTIKGYEKQMEEQPVEFAMGFMPFGMAKVAPKIPIKPPIPKILQPLAQEARKYKSAEEFEMSLARKFTIGDMTKKVPKEVPAIGSIVKTKLTTANYEVVEVVGNRLRVRRVGTHNIINIDADEVESIIKGKLIKTRFPPPSEAQIQATRNKYAEQLRHDGFDSLTDFYTQATKGVGGVGEAPTFKEAQALQKQYTEKLRNEMNARIAGKLEYPKVMGETGGVSIPKELEPLAQETKLLGQGNPLQRIMDALKIAKPLRGKQEAIYSKIRGQQAAKIVAMGEKVPGEQGYFAQLGQLKGGMPKVQFESVRKQVSQSDIDYLFNQVEKNNILLPFEKITTKTGLSKLLGAEGGAVPTEGELKLLGEVFPPEFIQSVLDKRPLMQKLLQLGGEALNVPRAMMATADLSAPLRQGIFLAPSHPKAFTKAFGSMFKYAFSEKAYQGLMQSIKARPNYRLMRDSKLALTEIGGPLTSREEVFVSQLPEKIPIIGRVVRGSNRAYTGFLNKLRADVFDDLVKTAEKQGVKLAGKPLDDIAKFVNSASGRGDIGSLNRAAIALNGVFFSPRLMMSRLNLLNPVYYARLDPFARKEALKSLFAFTGTIATILGLAKMGGAEVGIDPRSADFAKIKIGNTRYDIGGGFQQYIRIASQLLTGESVSSTTGLTRTLGMGYNAPTRLDILARFLQTKQAPIASFVTDLLKGETYFGEPIDVPKEIAQRFTPMVIQDMYDLAKEKDSPLGAMLATPAIFGVGTQTYAATERDKLLMQLLKIPSYQGASAEEKMSIEQGIKQSYASKKKAGRPFSLMQYLLGRTKRKTQGTGERKFINPF